MSRAAIPAPRTYPATDDPGVSPSPERESGGTFLSALNALLRHRRLLFGCALLAGAVGGTWAFTRERTYSSTSSFIAEGRQTAAGGLAAQLGLALPGTDVAQSPQFYLELLRSREILGAAVSTKFTVPGVTTTPTSLIDLYQVDSGDAAIRRDDAMLMLSEAVDPTLSPRTNVITLKVKAMSPVLAQQLNRRLFELVEDFNLRRRQSRASEERRFAEGRLTSVKSELRTAEDRLQSFLQSNRDYRNSPSLTFSYERLQADVLLLRELVTSLQESAEQAKIDEVRDTPIITLVESPDLPVRPDPRGAIKFALIGAVLGTFLALGMVFLRETLSRSSVRTSTDYEEFVALRREAAHDLRHPWQALTGARRRRAGVEAAQ